MNTLDRYIARQYLFNVVALLVLLFSFVVAIDVALNIDKFLENAGTVAGEGSGAVRRFAIATIGIVDLWWPRLLQLFVYVTGLVLVAAMGFTFTQMVRHREMVAVLAGGQSLYRLARPILIVAAGVLLLRVINQEFVLSRSDIAVLLTRDTNDIGHRDWSQFRVNLLADAQNRRFWAQSFDPATNEMTKLHIWERDADGSIKRVITADKAVWSDPSPDPGARGSSGGTGGWDLVNAKVQTISLSASGSGSATTSEPAPKRIITGLDPATLKFNRFAMFSQTLSWSQIGEMLSSPLIKPEVAEKLQRTRWSRVSQALSAILALIITMPFYLVREPKNMMIQSLKCAPVGILALMGGVMLSLVPWQGLPPGFAVFIPVLLLCPVAVMMVTWMRT